MRSLPPLISFILLVLVSVARAEEPPPLAKLHTDPFTESLREDAPVGGLVVVGVTARSERVSKQLGVWLPGATAAAGRLCVRVVSLDGRYWSQNEFEVPAGTSRGYVQLDYRTKHEDLLEQLGPDALAVLAYPGECRRAAPSAAELLVTSRSLDERGEPAELVLLVNAGRARALLRLRSEDGTTVQLTCTMIEADRRTGFDTKCSVPVSSPSPASLRLELVRREFERLVGKEELVVRLGE